MFLKQSISNEFWILLLIFVIFKAKKNDIDSKNVWLQYRDYKETKNIVFKFQYSNQNIFIAI